METAVRKQPSTWLRVAFLFALGYLFLSSINLMGAGFSSLGGGFSDRLLTLTRDPFAGLMVGTLTTAIVQSSTLVSSLIVSMVAARTLTLEQAVPMIMGANIGTTITATLVALGYVGRRGRFRRAFAAATMHDFFNILTVITLFPLQMTTKFLSKTATWISSEFASATHFDSAKSPVTIVLCFLKDFVCGLLKGEMALGNVASGIIMLCLATGLLLFSLYYLTKTMRSFMSGAMERVLDRYIFKRPIIALFVGMVLTALIHSSSVTTSLTVPLITAGVLTMEQVFPYTMGANIGTTITAVCAGFGTGQPAAFAIAVVHMVFNCTGVAIFFPVPRIRRIPTTLARMLAALTLRSRWYALLYILIVFFVVPCFFLLGLKYLRMLWQ